MKVYAKDKKILGELIQSLDVIDRNGIQSIRYGILYLELALSGTRNSWDFGTYIMERDHDFVTPSSLSHIFGIISHANGKFGSKPNITVSDDRDDAIIGAAEDKPGKFCGFHWTEAGVDLFNSIFKSKPRISPKGALILSAGQRREVLRLIEVLKAFSKEGPQRIKPIVVILAVALTGAKTVKSLEYELKRISIKYKSPLNDITTLYGHYFRKSRRAVTKYGKKPFLDLGRLPNSIQLSWTLTQYGSSFIRALIK